MDKVELRRSLIREVLTTIIKGIEPLCLKDRFKFVNELRIEMNRRMADIVRIGDVER